MTDSEEPNLNFLSSNDDDISTKITCDPIVQAQLLHIQKNISHLVEPPTPSPPVFDPTMSMKRRVFKIQQYINTFQYNHTGKPFFVLRRDKGMKHLVYTAKCMIREPFPIQCVEAVFLAVYLTNTIKELLRIPISFKTKMEDSEYSHIILAIRHRRKWGAIGISRIDTLMNKNMIYDSLAALVKEFENSYKKCWHEVVNVSVGLPFSHDDISECPIQWKVLKLSLQTLLWEDISDILSNYTSDCMHILEYFCHQRKLPDISIDDYKKGIFRRAMCVRKTLKFSTDN